MNIRRIKFWSMSVAAISLVGSVATIAVSLWSPIHVDEAQSELLPKNNSATRQIQNAPRLTAEAFEDVMDLELRRPLVDVPLPVPKLRSATQSASMGIQLTGTFVEPGHSFAVFELPGGLVEVRSIGQRTSNGSAEVVQIDAGSVLLRIDGQPQVLKVTKVEGKPRL